MNAWVVTEKEENMVVPHRCKESLSFILNRGEKTCLSLPTLTVPLLSF